MVNFYTDTKLLFTLSNKELRQELKSRNIIINTEVDKIDIYNMLIEVDRRKIKDKCEKIDIKTIEESRHFMYQGSYGCVFYPSIPCKVDDKMNSKTINDNYVSGKYVTKVLPPEEAIIELKISSMLQKADPNNKYTIAYRPEICKKVDIPKDRIKECVNYKKKNIGVYMEYGGENIDNWIVNIRDNNSKVKAEYILCDMFLYAVEGLLFIHKAGIAHLDIKRANMLIKEHNKKKIPVYIDFGLASYKGADALVVDTYYCIWPPDFMLVQRKIKDLPKIVEEIKKCFREYSIDEIADIVDETTNVEYMKIYMIAIDMFLKNRLEYYKTVDIFSLGQMFYNILMKGTKFDSLLQKMIDLNPKTRINGSELEKECKKLRKMLNYAMNN